MTDGNVLLELSAVTRRFDSPDGQAGPEVLKGVDLQVSAGEAMAVVGPSGCGKSTLLNIMGGLDHPSSGTVRLAGRDLSGLSQRALAAVRNREIGFIFQLHHLLPQCTALENVLVPTLVADESVRDGASQRARRLLERVGLGERLNYRPGQLSGGERQRVAVVRALINGPRLLLADEPTGSLDRHMAAELAELLAAVNREEQTTLVLVTHSRALAGQMDRVVELRGGVLAEPDQAEQA
ncbi:hypothetical protein LCGC14_2306010 [marine sediment metagenome]|uniref:ABC transporter domain-containing protein n=1 Tax=marine sediment metagenome TaxID=412755 RepID=A0A0F9D9J4_9ZZZZ